MRGGYIQRDAEGKPVALYLSAINYQPPRKFKRGDRVLASGSPATVRHFYRTAKGYLVDLWFDDGRMSDGHFAYGLEPLG